MPTQNKFDVLPLVAALCYEVDGDHETARDQWLLLAATSDLGHVPAQDIVVQRVFSMYNTYLTPVQLTQLTAPQAPAPAQGPPPQPGVRVLARQQQAVLLSGVMVLRSCIRW